MDEEKAKALRWLNGNLERMNADFQLLFSAEASMSADLISTWACREIFKQRRLPDLERHLQVISRLACES